MRQMWKRGVAFLLIGALGISLCTMPGEKAFAEELAEEGESEEREEGMPSDEEGEEDAATIPLEAIHESEPEEEEAEDEEDSTLNPLAVEEPSTYTLSLKYDDRYLFSDFGEADLSGYVISDIETVSVSSYQVSAGEKTGTLDSSVVTANASGDGLIAVGVGDAVVTLSDTAGDTICLSVTVAAAPLTVMFIAGQSNAEGIPSSTNGAHPEDSVLCEEGCVYTTYAPCKTSYGVSVTGLSEMSACTAANADSFVAGSLTGTTSLTGSKLTYPLNALTASGNGKNGMDSGLAYEWNQLTGDKVWVVNAAWSGTSITTWIPGGSSYERARNVYQDVMKTAKAEVSAGHYTLQDTLLFWLQGEADKSMSTSTYLSNYQKMYKGFQSEDLGIEYYGIIMVRANTGSRTNAEDLSMTGPRVAQYLLGNSTEYPDIYVVSNVNEQWVTDSGVKSYFKNKYGSALSYPLRSNTTLSGLPTTVSKVHGDTHYAQVAYNENGITAAQTMYDIVYGQKSGTVSISWYDEDGTVHAAGETCTVGMKSTTCMVPVVAPLSRSKEISVSSNLTRATYDPSTATLTTQASSSGTLTAKIGSITSSISVSNTPILKSESAAANGTKITWEAVPGATGYAVFRKLSGGSWSRQATTTSTSYTDKSSLKNGKTYYYTVRAYCGTQSKALANTYSTSYWSPYDSSGLKVIYTQIPTLKSSTTNTTSGIKVKWSKVSGATGYTVYRKKSGGSWTTLGTTTSTSYTDKTAKAGTTYYYTVRAYRGTKATAQANTYDAKYWSGYNSSGVSGRFLKTPVLKQAKKSSGSVKISWSKVSNATGYAVYRKTAGGKWSMIGTTKSTSYVDKSKRKKGKTYYYTVRAYRGSLSTAKKNKYKSKYWSSYDSSGVKAKK